MNDLFYLYVYNDGQRKEETIQILVSNITMPHNNRKVVKQEPRRSNRLAKKYQKFLPYVKDSLISTFCETLTQCQIPYCKCARDMKKISNNTDEDLIDATYHVCTPRHHDKCQLLHRYIS